MKALTTKTKTDDVAGTVAQIRAAAEAGADIQAIDLGSFNLDVALTALEQQGRGRLLSTPKITTQNNQAAEIKQGVQIPIQTLANNTVIDGNFGMSRQDQDVLPPDYGTNYGLQAGIPGVNNPNDIRESGLPVLSATYVVGNGTANWMPLWRKEINWSGSVGVTKVYTKHEMRAGFDFDRSSEKEGRSIDVKRRKLGWAKEILETLAQSGVKITYPTP